MKNLSDKQRDALLGTVVQFLLDHTDSNLSSPELFNQWSDSVGVRVDDSDWAIWIIIFIERFRSHDPKIMRAMAIDDGIIEGMAHV